MRRRNKIKNRLARSNFSPSANLSEEVFMPKPHEEETRSENEWLIKEFNARFIDPPKDIAPEEIKRLVTESIEREKKDKTFLITSLILICIAIFSYISKVYLVLTLDLFILFIYGSIYFAPENKPNEYMICPHCKTKGQVFTQAVTLKKGIDGGKATGAILTGGISLVATGLSRKENQTRANCGKCGSVWHF
jgi:hypothetical protein